ncbi:hypothetical protein F5B21DRAFT_520187 [Xylaria acuta]|nr:hypothetical protein F5B21DRAFT_520187 [Xylaria acuta]
MVPCQASNTRPIPCSIMDRVANASRAPGRYILFFKSPVDRKGFQGTIPGSRPIENPVDVATLGKVVLYNRSKFNEVRPEEQERIHLDITRRVWKTSSTPGRAQPSARWKYTRDTRVAECFWRHRTGIWVHVRRDRPRGSQRDLAQKINLLPGDEYKTLPLSQNRSIKSGSSRDESKKPIVVARFTTPVRDRRQGLECQRRAPASLDRRSSSSKSRRVFGMYDGGFPQPRPTYNSSRKLSMISAGSPRVLVD